MPQIVSVQLARQICVLLTSLGLASVARANSRINSGTEQWLAAATTGRADMLFFGDSIVNYGSGGWTNGFAQALHSSTLGLAGSGLIAAPLETGYTWANYTGARVWGPASTDSVAAGVASLTPSGRSYDASSGFSFVGTGADTVSLDSSRPIDWHIFASGRSLDAQLQATQRRRNTVTGSDVLIQTTGIQSVTYNPSQLSDYTFHFDGTSVPGNLSTFGLTSETLESTVHYMKLTQADATGVAVSGWGFPGGTAQGFRDMYYNHPRFTAAGRTAMYQSLVAGNSGKLNVVIAFGVNDALTAAFETFDESVRGLIGDVRRDWQAAGLNSSDLSFSLLSSYQVNQAGYPTDSFFRLDHFRSELDAIAAQDDQISFIDIWEAGPTWQQAMANHYLVDNIHPSDAGTPVYGRALLEQLIPKPGDADRDGDIDFDDLLALTQNYGTVSGATWRQGDFNEDEAVLFDDLLLISQNYGWNASVALGSFESDLRLARSLVPEPMSLICVGLLAACRRRRLRRSPCHSAL